MILDKVNMPEDVKKLTFEEMKFLAGEIRELIIKKNNAIGGHMGPNLGIVEAIIAMHYVFNSPVDKFVFDVSHQCYPHKILTGRKEGFTDSDKYLLYTGYTAPEESEHDLFKVGHTSTSVSLACGVAKARDLKGENFNTIALIGDGSLSGGEALEGLDNAAALDSNLIIIVNDNDMSIAENHGGLYENLKFLRETNGKAECNFFKSLGFEYHYVSDGNNVEKLVEAFENVKDSQTIASPVCNNVRKVAFTLAEVLVTLGVIGVVAALTMPVITENVQKVTLRNQLKKFYTNFSNGIERVKTNLNPDIYCYYWDVNPYVTAGNPAVCSKKNVYGTCTAWKMSDGTPLKSNYNGNVSQCRAFDNEMFGNVLQVVKFCDKNALANGCIPDSYKGTDKVNAKEDPNIVFSETSIKNKYPVWVLNDGTIVIRYYAVGSLPLYAVDVNGKKDPNKWGYDLFAFTLNGNKIDGISEIRGSNYANEKGGTYSSVMFKNLFSQ